MKNKFNLQASKMLLDPVSTQSAGGVFKSDNADFSSQKRQMQRASIVKPSVFNQAQIASALDETQSSVKGPVHSPPDNLQIRVASTKLSKRATTKQQSLQRGEDSVVEERND